MWNEKKLDKTLDYYDRPILYTSRYNDELYLICLFDDFYDSNDIRTEKWLNCLITEEELASMNLEDERNYILVHNLYKTRKSFVVITKHSGEYFDSYYPSEKEIGEVFT